MQKLKLFCSIRPSFSQIQNPISKPDDLMSGFVTNARALCFIIFYLSIS
jgi:hypothetical protein